MRFLLIFLLTAVLLPAAYSSAAEHTIEIGWSIERTADTDLAGFRLYDLEHNSLCETKDPLATSLRCTVDTPDSQATFTLVSFSTQGIESTPSSPFTIFFAEALPLQADFDFMQEEETLTVNFSPTGSTGLITGFAWDFKDGSPVDTSPTPRHTFSAAATYEVSLTITDAAGKTETTTQSVTLTPLPGENKPPTADLAITSGAPTGNAPLTVTFDAGNSSDPEDSSLNFSWEFGDGTRTTGPASMTHIYTTAGTYTATVTVTDSQGATSSAASQPIIVSSSDSATSGAAALITASSTSGPAPMVVRLSGAASTPSDTDGTITAYAWNFADGSTAAGKEVQHVFTEPGEYAVQLTVTDSNGNQAKTSKILTVLPPEQNPVPALIQIYNLLLLKQ